jgi:hypothetical protein
MKKVIICLLLGLTVSCGQHNKQSKWKVVFDGLTTQHSVYTVFPDKSYPVNKTETLSTCTEEFVSDEHNRLEVKAKSTVGTVVTISIIQDGVIRKSIAWTTPSNGNLSMAYEN